MVITGIIIGIVVILGIGYYIHRKYIKNHTNF